MNGIWSRLRSLSGAEVVAIVLVPLVLIILVVALVNRFKPESTPPESEAYSTYLALSREAGLSEAVAREKFDQEWIDRWGLVGLC